MNKQELIDEIVKKTGQSKSAATESLDAFIEAVKSTVAKGETIQLVGFGSFSQGSRAAREGRNPKTGETLKIAAAKTAKFVPGKAFKDAVNEK